MQATNLTIHILLTHCGKSYNTGCPFANSVKNGCLAIFADVMGDLKVSKCSTSLGMYHSLWDSFPVKMTHLIQKLDILQQDRSPRSNCHGGGLCVNGTPSSSGEHIRCLDNKTTKKNELQTFCLLHFMQY